MMQRLRHHIVTNRQIRNKCPHEGRGIKAEPALEQTCEQPVLTNCVTRVPVAELGRNHESVRTLAERIVLNGSEGGLSGGRISSCLSCIVTESLESVDNDVAQPLTFDHHPVVVPVR